ncbi:hypothetical protein M514_06464 [Trichuris suis]|uniref:Uncharacterized protein n=1 Tax=Trichuris suis TaxID=68888 RepID=A0A085N222_9BILA|nr:hypothetical protein M513_06464 [Trichuris suis]KFD63518.1 hypothetical protein M514_06464 [Trichuris suis]
MLQKTHLELKEGAVSIFRNPFPLALEMHNAVEKELQRYIELRVLSPADRSSWAAPILKVKKLNSLAI